MSESKPKTAQAIFKDIQGLDPDERELLVTMIQLDEINEPASDEITRAWIEESKRRMKLIEEGKAGWVEGEQALKQLRESVAE
jgi:hypothetical protein